MSSNKEISNAVLAFENTNIINSLFEDNKTSKNCSNIRIFGSNCLDLANTASGKIDCYYCSSIDNIRNSAGLLIVEESGGIKIDINNIEYSILTNSYLADILKNLYA